MNLRRATVADRAALIECAADFFSRLPGYPAPVPDRLAAHVAAVLERGFCIVAERGAGICASLAVERCRWEWADGEYLSERWWWGADSTAARAVLDAGRALSDRLQLPLYVGDRSGDRALAKARLWRRWGFDLAGAAAVYRPT